MDPMDVDNTTRHPPVASPFAADDSSPIPQIPAIPAISISSISVPGHHHHQQQHLFRPSHTHNIHQQHRSVNGTQSPFQTGTLSPFKSPPMPMSPSPIPSIFPPSTTTKKKNTITNSLPPFDPSSYTSIPDSLPDLTPSYPAALFGGLSSDDEHVTVWEPKTGKTVAGNAAPYRRNLVQWLGSHQGWEEKADELKSSKRRAAARKSKSAAVNFASLCAFPIAKLIATHALRKFKEAGVGNPGKSLSSWSPEDYVRLQEILFRVAQEAYAAHYPKSNDHINSNTNVDMLPHDCWERVAQHIGGNNKKATDIVYLAHHMLEFGIQKTAFELDAAHNGKNHNHNDNDNNNNNSSSATSPGGGVREIGIPGRGNGNNINNNSNNNNNSGSAPGSYDSGWRAPGSFGALSLPNMGSEGLSAITNSFRTPKEPRITVWHPETGKTISGNAAPCRRNLETWMKQHPGWQPKAETQLSSARRSRAKKNSSNSNGRPMSVPINTPRGRQYYYNVNSNINNNSMEDASPQLEAAHGLLGLSTSFGSYNSNNGLLGKGNDIRNRNSNSSKKIQISSVSSSGADDGEDEGDSTEDEDEMEM